jgi:ABC-type Zn uptake system ZnuABC Zn-binding protein ZnuA
MYTASAIDKEESMRRLVLLGLALVFMCLVPSEGAGATIRVVATIPDLADMARHIGGDLLDVKSIATGVEDIQPCR